MEIPQTIEREIAFFRRHETQQFQRAMRMARQTIAITMLAIYVPGIICWTRASFSFQGLFRPAAYATGLVLGVALGTLIALLLWRQRHRYRSAQSTVLPRRWSPMSIVLSSCFVLGIPFLPFLTGSLGPATSLSLFNGVFLAFWLLFLFPLVTMALGRMGESRVEAS